MWSRVVSTAAGTQRRRVQAALGFTVLALLLLLWASAAEFPRFTAEPPGAQTPPDEPPAPEDGASVPPPQQEGLSFQPSAEPGELSPWIWVALQIAAAVALCAAFGLLLLLLRQVVRWWSGRRSDRSEPDPMDEALEAAVAATGEQVRRRAAQRTPTDAVVACWAALEEAAEQAGLRRTGSETAEEFTAGVLDHWEVDHQLITELAELYRTARFSRLELTEEDRGRALRALTEINISIEARRLEMIRQRGHLS